MIDIKVIWLPQIISYAKFVLDLDKPRDCWVHGRCEFTSVTSFDEMIVQIFDDLDSDNMLEDAQIDSTLSEGLVKSTRDFLLAIKETDQVNESSEWADAPEALLASAEWRTVIDRAGDLVSVAAAAGYQAMR